MSRDWNELISAYLDGELDAVERAEFERRLEAGEISRTELKEMQKMRDLTDSFRLQSFPDHEWDRYWERTYNRLERNLGWILVSLGAIVLLSVGLYELLREWLLDGASPWWLRAATGSLALGLGFLFVSVVRERLFVRRTDPYRGIER
jgi:anti-sigma factor RsiW